MARGGDRLKAQARAPGGLWRSLETHPKGGAEWRPSTIRYCPVFNPDPSICRVGDDYYIATSTFEWCPGVQIHHSRDLVNWRLVTRPLDRATQLDMRGEPDSGGIWAPCLSHADGKFWLVYTDVKRLEGAFKDAHNSIVTAPAIEGPWSDPTYVNSSGFDPSLFHDDDGRKWFLNMVWDHRNDVPPRIPVFSGRRARAHAGGINHLHFAVRVTGQTTTAPLRPCTS